MAALDESRVARVLVCSPADADDACEILAQARTASGVQILAERGLSLERPDVASGRRLVDPHWRSHAQLFDTAFDVYHAQPWSERSRQSLSLVSLRDRLAQFLPSDAALQVRQPGDAAAASRRQVVEAVAERFAVNTISVYDWLTGIPTEHYDASPLRELSGLVRSGLAAAVRPFVGTLKKQYRMHPSLSSVPRRLFYFGEALHDGAPSKDGGCRVRFVRVTGARDSRENAAEVDAVCQLLKGLDADDATRAAANAPAIMIITPYRDQEALLHKALDDLRARELVTRLDPEVCTLDRCQGREADYVLISLVRSKPTTFLDMPKRWNVALTRARCWLFLVGDIDAYLTAASRARHWSARSGQLPRISMLARVIEAYDQQVAGTLEDRR